MGLEEYVDRLPLLWGAVITACRFQIMHHRLQIEAEARYEHGRTARYRLTLTGIASLTMMNGSLQSGKEFYDSAWDYAELTSITVKQAPRLGGTFLRVVIEVWSTQIEILCLDLTIRELADGGE